MSKARSASQPPMTRQSRPGRRPQNVLRELLSLIIGGHTNEAISLIRAGAPINKAAVQGTTALYLAAVQGETEIARYLLEQGADPNLESKGVSEGTPLCAAAAWGRTDIVKVLLDHGANPNQVERKDEGGGMTALKWARDNHHQETAQLLIEHGAVEG